jgi:hypothetical protein
MKGISRDPKDVPLDAFRDPSLPREIREAFSELEGYRDTFNESPGHTLR